MLSLRRMPGCTKRPRPSRLPRLPRASCVRPRLPWRRQSPPPSSQPPFSAQLLRRRELSSPTSPPLRFHFPPLPPTTGNALFKKNSYTASNKSCRAPFCVQTLISSSSLAPCLQREIFLSTRQYTVVVCGGAPLFFSSFFLVVVPPPQHTGRRRHCDRERGTGGAGRTLLFFPPPPPPALGKTPRPPARTQTDRRWWDGRSVSVGRKGAAAAAAAAAATRSLKSERKGGER